MVRFGIIGLGSIAHKFAQDLLLVDGVTLQAVSSRSTSKAQEFANTFSATRFYGSYQKLLEDDQVDVIYIATPHSFHYDHTMMCLNAGKAVLCEKPFAMNKEQVQEMIHAAQENHVFLMEALWSRFMPSFIKLKHLIKDDLIGEIKLVQADFGFEVPLNKNNRLTESDLGGGALLDIGIYPLFLSLFLLGVPDSLTATAKLKNNTDRQVGIKLNYENAMSMLYCSFEHYIPIEATIHGTKGRIYLKEAFHECEQLVIQLNNGSEDVINVPHKGLGYVHEIEETRDCINAGKIESEQMSWKDSLDLIKLLDDVRSKIGLSYE